jgi:hypothetical protein
MLNLPFAHSHLFWCGCAFAFMRKNDGFDKVLCHGVIYDDEYHDDCHDDDAYLLRSPRLVNEPIDDDGDAVDAIVTQDTAAP